VLTDFPHGQTIGHIVKLALVGLSLYGYVAAENILAFIGSLSFFCLIFLAFVAIFADTDQILSASKKQLLPLWWNLTPSMCATFYFAANKRFIVAFFFACEMLFHVLIRDFYQKTKEDHHGKNT
jgi:hypothetical protein